MPTDHIRYDILAQEALRGVVRTVLEDVAKKGLPGEHHFKITFATTAPGVRLSERMRGQYPDVMTIVLQHQFWDLAVSDDSFGVGLSFGGVPERLEVPFASITAFYDPAVQFGFQFETMDAEAAPDRGSAEKSAETPAVTRPQGVGPKSDTKSDTRSDTKPDALPAPAAAKPKDPAPEGGGGGEIVRLDRFRKK
jgi:uncharacterized protein